MKVVSWNVWNLSRDPEAFERYVRDQDADVFAFQELTEAHIDILRSMEKFRLFLADDFIEGEQVTRLGLFSRHNADDHRVVTHNPDRNVSPSWIGRRNEWVECLQSQSVSVHVDGRQIKIVNVHLSCAVSPRRRLRELEVSLADTEAETALIVCGDMNTFGNSWLNWLVGWFYGFGIRDLLTNEVNALSAFAAGRGMRRIPTTAVTFPKLRLHLDHFLVRGLNIESCRVGEKTNGSDHKPILCLLAD